MRRAFITLLVFTLIFLSYINAQNERKEIGNLVIEGIPDIPERISERIFQYQNIA